MLLLFAVDSLCSTNRNFPSLPIWVLVLWEADIVLSIGVKKSLSLMISWRNYRNLLMVAARLLAGMKNSR
jgi:hypothetical protein